MVSCRRMRNATLALLLTLSASSALAATRTWTGTTSGLWSVAANWGGTAPVAGDDLVFPSGASNPTNSNDFPADTAFQSITIGAGYSMAGNVIDIGAGGISGTAGTSAVAIPFKLAASQTWTSSGTSLTLSGAIDLNNQNLTLDNASPSFGTISGPISGAGLISKGFNGDWTLSGSNTFSGQVIVNAGRLFALNALALGIADNTAANGTQVNSGGTLNLGNALVFPAERITINGSGNGGNGVLQTSGDATVNGTVVLGTTIAVAMNLPTGQKITFDGIVTGSGQFGMGGGGIYLLDNPGNDFSGPVLWGATGTSNSILTLGVDSAFPAGKAINVPSAGTFNLNTHAQSIASLAGAGTVGLGSGGTLTITGGSTTFSGVITGNGSVVHSGGTLTLTGANTYAGSYSNTGGTTRVNGATGGALPASYTQSAGLLDLSSNATAGNVIINGGTIRPGDSGTGSANTGNLTFGAAATLDEGINAAVAGLFGSLHVTGTVNLGGAALLLSGSGGAVAPGNAFVIIDNDGADPVNGTFAGLPQGTTISNGPGGFDYTISYTGGSGNDVVLTAAAPAVAGVPALDPKLLAALGVVLAGLAIFAIRR